MRNNILKLTQAYSQYNQKYFGHPLADQTYPLHMLQIWWHPLYNIHQLDTNHQLYHYQEPKDDKVTVF